MTQDHVHALKQALDDLTEVYKTYTELCYRVATGMRAGDISEVDLVDSGFLLREAEDLADRLRKDAKMQKEIVSKKIAKGIIERSINNASAPLKKTGKLCTAVADVKQSPVLPKRGTPEYHELLTWLGVPEQFIESGVLRPHWQGLQDYVTDLGEKAHKAPKGLLGVVTEATVIYYRKRAKK